MNAGAWTFTEDVHAYEAAAGDLLRSRPVENTVALTVLENARSRPTVGERYGWWTAADGTVTGAVSHTPHFPVLLAVVPEEALDPLVRSGEVVGGVAGETRLATHCAALWSHRTGGRVRLEALRRLYRLETFVPPKDPGGSGRVATAADIDFLVAAYTGFGAETGGSTHADVSAAITDRLGFGGLWVWDNAAGTPVAMAGHTRSAAGMVRVAPVFTVPDERGRGYGSAVTAAVSGHLLRSGARDVVLFTELTNPISNAIYQRIGYRALADQILLQFA